MGILECECGFTIDDEPDLSIIMFVEHRRVCKVWADILNKLVNDTPEGAKIYNDV